VLLSWDFPHPVEKATLSMKGNAEIYGVMTDGRGGVAVDNIPLRGCSGTIFTRIDEDLMTRSFALDDTRLIILQFGGNYMPAVKSTRIIENYQKKITNQIQYFRRVAPQAKILFIGPSDMGKSVRGHIVTWPYLPEMVEALKATARENGIAYWDLYGVMGGKNSMGNWVKHNPPYAGPDYIHFTQKGARIVGDALAKSLLVYYDFYTLRKTLPGDRVDEYMKQ
jgi:lysophospholipase L1-like esterase